jgi:hypothetical protein
MYPDGWFEVKSVGVSAVAVTISSLEQLDCQDEGCLIVIRLDKVAPDRTGAFSLNDIIHRISKMLNADALDLLRAKLSAYGYIDLQEYSDPKYYCAGQQAYCVDDTFPRLTAKTVPAQIVSAHYDLNLPSLVDWEKE